MRRRVLLPLVLALLVPLTLSAETWLPKEVTCPVCGTVNLFQVPGSYGSYVFRDRARFQYVFWPATTDTFLYTCRQCHLTRFMGDFNWIAPEKIADLARMLKTEATIEGKLVPYTDIPMAVRLPIAEKVYRVLGGDAAFWGAFHRIEGYHYAVAGLDERAATAQRQALEIAERESSDETRSDRKESLVILAATRFHLGDVAGVREALAEASKSTYRLPEGNAEEIQEKNRFLDELIEAFHTELLR